MKKVFVRFVAYTLVGIEVEDETFDKVYEHSAEWLTDENIPNLMDAE